MRGAPCCFGTVDTKSDEIALLRDRIVQLGARVLMMDVGVLGRGHATPDIHNTEVAQAAGVTLPRVIASGDENTSMNLMSRGATRLATERHAQKVFDGLPAPRCACSTNGCGRGGCHPAMHRPGCRLICRP